GFVADLSDVRVQGGSIRVLLDPATSLVESLPRLLGLTLALVDHRQEKAMTRVAALLQPHRFLEGCLRGGPIAGAVEGHAQRRPEGAVLRLPVDGPPGECRGPGRVVRPPRRALSEGPGQSVELNNEALAEAGQGRVLLAEQTL